MFGLPVAQITWSYGQYEQVAQQFWIPQLKKMMTKASGAHNPTNTIMAVALRNMRHLAS